MKIVHLPHIAIVLFLALALSFSGLTPCLTVETSFAKSNKEKKTGKSKKEESKAKETKKSKKSKKPAKELPAPNSISINKASKEELMRVPGIGPKTADAIIAYRKENSFSSLEDLIKVKGIGEKSFTKMKKYLKK